MLKYTILPKDANYSINHNDESASLSAKVYKNVVKMKCINFYRKKKKNATLLCGA